MFASGKKPMKQYNKLINEKNSDEIIAGNRDGIGASRSTLQKIASESRQIHRKDVNLIQSLLDQKGDFEKSIYSNKTTPGFIQYISLHPCCVFLWSYASVVTWHEMCKRDAAFFDATGGIVRKDDSDKGFLYYEISFRNPIRNQTSIPI